MSVQKDPRRETGNGHRLRAAWERMLDLIYPPKCPFCGRVLERVGVCPACEKALSWTEEAEGCWQLSASVRCAAPLWYEGLARQGILRYKFHGASGAAAPLGELAARCAAERFSGQFDTVAWVPVSRRRLRQRGYDQSRLLAERACRLWQTRPERLLVKTEETPAQSGLRCAAARRANVLGVYAPCGAPTGKRILLVDDICTTGATLLECARTLKEAGAAEVMCLTLAKTREKFTK